MEKITEKAVQLILKVYIQAYEEYTEEGPDGVAFEGICIEDELFDEICEFVGELRQELGIEVDDRANA